MKKGKRCNIDEKIKKITTRDREKTRKKKYGK